MKRIAMLFTLGSLVLGTVATASADPGRGQGRVVQVQNRNVRHVALHPTYAPPRARIEHVVPRAGYVWIAGEYEWLNGEYVWIGGHWEVEQVGQFYTSGRWERQNDRYTFVRGEWREREQREEHARKEMHGRELNRRHDAR